MHRKNNSVVRNPQSSQNNVVSLQNNELINQNKSLQGMGFEIFGEQEFVRYPVIGINQPTSDYKPEGKFHNRVTGDIYDSIDVVLLALSRSMSFRPHGYNDPVPSCFSSNALRPDSSVEQPVFRTCHRSGPRGLVPECPNAQWVRGPEGKARRACNLRYTAAIECQGSHYLFYFQGRSIAPLEKFLSQLRQFRQPLFGMRINLSLTYRTKKEGFMGNFYEINFPDLSNPMDRERVQAIDALEHQESASFFKDYFKTAPSDLYHEGEDNQKTEAPPKKGIQYTDTEEAAQKEKNPQHQNQGALPPVQARQERSEQHQSKAHSQRQNQDTRNQWNDQHSDF